MSRGLGALQRLVVDSLTQREPTQFNVLCWNLAAQTGRISRGEVDRSFYSSLLRAIWSLKGRVNRRKRKLVNLDEVVRFYPYKTRKYRIRHLREQILPVLKDHIEEREAAKFTTAETEHHLYGQLTEKQQESGRSAWYRIEGRLYGQMASTQHDRRDAYVALLVRGRELFAPPVAMSHRDSFWSLFIKAFDSPNLTEEERHLRDDMEDLYRRYFPRSVVAHARLKSQLYAILDFGDYGRARLKEKSKEVLLEKLPRVVEALPGHRPDGKQKVGKFYLPQEVRFSPVLDEVISRDALAPFDFLVLA